MQPKSSPGAGGERAAGRFVATKGGCCWSGTNVHVEQQAMKDSFTQGQGNPSASHSELEKAPGLYLRATQFEASSRKTSSH